MKSTKDIINLASILLLASMSLAIGDKHLISPSGPKIQIGLRDKVGGGTSGINLETDDQNIGTGTVHDEKTGKTYRVHHIYKVLYYDAGSVRVRVSLHKEGSPKSEDFNEDFQIFDDRPTIRAPFQGVVLEAKVIQPAKGPPTS